MMSGFQLWHVLQSGRSAEQSVRRRRPPTVTPKEASTLKSGDCVTTVHEEETITKHTTSDVSGIYTGVTMADEYLSCCERIQFVVSPFASNHLITNSFYNIHRVIFKLLLPKLLKLW